MMRGALLFEDELQVGDPGELRELFGKGRASGDVEAEGVEGVEEGVGFVVEGARGEEERG